MTLRHHIDLREGETFSFSFTFRDAAGDAVDVSGYSARMAVRENFIADADLILSSDGSTPGGTITLEADGTVTLGLTAVRSAAILEDRSIFLLLDRERYHNKRYVIFVYDLELTSPAGVVTRALEGNIIVSRRVTE